MTIPRFRLVSARSPRHGYAPQMSRYANAAEFVASDAFWHDPAPATMAVDGVHSPDVLGTPENHLFFATSGTCGVAKWIALSKKALLASANAVNKHLGVSLTSVWGFALPIHHVGGFGVVARARAAGCALEIFADPWCARAFSGWVAAHHITHTSLVPTQVHDLVAAGCRAPSGLVAVVVGGGRLEIAEGQAARDLGWPVLASYGLTEAASQVATQPLMALAHPYAPSPISVLTHWRVRAGADGCLEISGPALFSGTTCGGVYQPRKDDWYATRDRVSITSAGLVPHGRADAFVKIAGELIDPQEVELRLRTALGQLGGSLAVVVVPDARLGHRLAVVAERSLSASALADAIGAYNDAVARSQRIGEPVFIEELPRGELGKIQRLALREMIERDPLAPPP